jgi:predicted S18 family serine protease
MWYFLLGMLVGWLSLIAVALIDAIIKKKKIKKMLEQSAQSAKDFYGFDITKFTKGAK